jgi:hypothetical protein
VGLTALTSLEIGNNRLTAFPPGLLDGSPLLRGLAAQNN